MHPKHLSINNFTYHLPSEKIALHPLQERDQSKLLICAKEKITETIYKNIAGYLPENALLIFNNTKVIPARILFKKNTGATIEIFCLEPYENNCDYNSVMSKSNSVNWKCLIGGAGKWKDGALIKKIYLNEVEVFIYGKLQKKLSDSYVIEISWKPSHYTFAEIIEQAGKTPLPPYIKREVEENDKERYQTIYAENKGSVAAPTAGLHFTKEIFSSLESKNIKTGYITLHVGAGTFKPVKTEMMLTHQMHAEWIDVSVLTIENILKNTKEKIVSVGTTTLRTIESLYWMGVKCFLNADCTFKELEVKQWEVYEDTLPAQNISTTTALHALITWLKKNEMERIFIQTEILIAPGYNFKVVNALITNFHQPKSTLLLLIAAITKDWKSIYNHALKNNFRFLSFGDGCLLFIDN